MHCVRMRKSNFYHVRNLHLSVQVITRGMSWISYHCHRSTIRHCNTKRKNCKAQRNKKTAVNRINMHIIHIIAITMIIWQRVHITIHCHLVCNNLQLNSKNKDCNSNSSRGRSNSSNNNSRHYNRYHIVVSSCIVT